MPDHDDDKKKAQSKPQPQPKKVKPFGQEGSYGGFYGEHTQGEGFATSTFNGGNPNLSVKTDAYQRTTTTEVGFGMENVTEKMRTVLRVGYENKRIDARADGSQQQVEVVPANPNLPAAGNAAVKFTGDDNLSKAQFQGGTLSLAKHFNPAGVVTPFVSLKGGAGVVSSSLTRNDVRSAVAGLTSPVQYTGTVPAAVDNKGFGGMLRADAGIDDGRFIPGVKAHYEVIKGKGTQVNEVGADIFKNIPLNKSHSISLFADVGATMTTTKISNSAEPNSGLNTKSTKPALMASGGINFRF